MSYYYTCELCGEEVRGNFFPSHLKNCHDLSARDYYHKHVLKSEEVPKCRNKDCGKTLEFIRLSLPYQEFCNRNCSAAYNLEGFYEGIRRGAKTTADYSGKKNRSVCKICEMEIYDKFFPSHLKGCHGLSSRDYYHLYILKSEEVPTCRGPGCGKTLEFVRLSLPYPEFCSGSCKMKNQWTKPDFIEANKRAAQTRLSDPGYRKRRKDFDSKRFTAMNHKNHADPEWKTTKHKTWGVQGWHESPKSGQVYYRSSWELEACKYLDRTGLVKTYKLEPFGIPYGDGDDRAYYPDILITYYDDYQEIIEIKPSFRLFEEETMFKINLGLNYAFRNNLGFRVWTKSNWPENGGLDVGS